MDEFSLEIKKQTYKNKEDIQLINKEVELQKRDFELFKKEVKEDIKTTQRLIVYEIKDMLAVEFKEHSKWKDRTIIGFLTSVILMAIGLVLDVLIR